MPRKTKEQKELEIENESKKINKSSTSKTTRSKTTSSKTKKATSKVATTKASTRTTKSSAAKTSTRASKSAAGKPTKSSTSKSTKTAAKSTASKKTKTVASTKTSSSVKKASAKKETQNSKKVSIVEYYDLPYRYNQTVVKVLAQTPTNLFVYWDIADSDREFFKKEYGYDFFDKTRPILIVHNETMNYAFEVDINDFANSWYLHVNDANCDYKIELGRKPIYNYVQREVGELEQKDLNSDFNKYPSKPIDKDYFYVTISNDIDAPNNHILAEDYNKPINSVLIRNVKSNTEYTKNIDNLPISKYLNNLFNIQDIYKKLFEENTIKDFYDLSNPSSGHPSSGSFSSQFK